MHVADIDIKFCGVFYCCFSLLWYFNVLSGEFLRLHYVPLETHAIHETSLMTRVASSTLCLFIRLLEEMSKYLYT